MEDADLIRLSFGFIQDDLHPFVVRFYERWFALRPEMRAYFPKDTGVPSNQLCAALTLLAENAADLEALRPTLAVMGKQHRDMGIKQSYIHSLIDSLMGTFEEKLGEDWGELQSQAWRKALMRTWEIMYEVEPASD